MEIAIRGDVNRGNEVIALLEMLGGVNRLFKHTGTADGWYIISSTNNILYAEYLFDEYGFTLDDFNKKYPFKVGDIVTYTKFGEDGKEFPVTIETMRWTGEDVVYTFNDCVTCLAADLKMYYNEELTKNADIETKVETSGFMQMGKTIAVIFNEANYEDKVELQLGDYEIKVHDGKTYAVKKKSVYPKTYEECCEVIANSKPYAMNEDYTDVNKLLQTLQTILICRDAYWKIAGEQMGLGEPWKPDWNKETDKFTISNKCNKIYLNNTAWYSELLAFPTAEMRYAFYENFKDLIESCKELL